MLVLFGGGDGGGVYVSPSERVHRISQWNANHRSQLLAVTQLLKAHRSIADDRLRQESVAIAERITSGVIPAVLRDLSSQVLAVPPSLAFFYEDEGFVCSPAGKHPVPFAIPRGAIRLAHVAAG
jgi:hypothetical protein